MGFRVWGLGFGVWGLGFRVWGLGFRVRWDVGAFDRSNWHRARTIETNLLGSASAKGARF